MCLYTCIITKGKKGLEPVQASGVRFCIAVFGLVCYLSLLGVAVPVRLFPEVNSPLHISTGGLSFILAVGAKSFPSMLIY